MSLLGKPTLAGGSWKLSICRDGIQVNSTEGRNKREGRPLMLISRGPIVGPRHEEIERCQLIPRYAPRIRVLIYVTNNFLSASMHSRCFTERASERVVCPHLDSKREGPKQRQGSVIADGDQYPTKSDSVEAMFHGWTDLPFNNDNTALSLPMNGHRSHVSTGRLLPLEGVFNQSNRSASIISSGDW